MTLKVDPGPGKWLVSGGTLSSGSGSTVVFTAKDTAGTAAVSVEVNGQKVGLQFQIVAPSEVHQAKIAEHHVAAGRPNAGFCADVFIGPSDVSFMNIKVREDEVQANDQGYWQLMHDKGHHPAVNPVGMLPTVVAGKGTKVKFPDQIFSGFPPVVSPTPSFAGSRTWDIPWFYKVGTGGEHPIATIRQQIVSAADGSATATKAGADASFALNAPTVNC